MTNIPLSTTAGEIYIKAGGTGTDNDPNIAYHHIQSVPADPFGTNTDAAVETDAAGSINAHIRGLIKLLAAVIDVPNGVLSVEDNTYQRTEDSVSVALQTDAIMSGLTALTPKFAPIAAATSGDNTLVAAVTAKKLRVHAVSITAAAAVSLYFQSGAAGDVIYGGSTNTIDLAANGSLVLPFSPVGWFETDAGELLNLNLSGAIKVAGGLTYTEV